MKTAKKMLNQAVDRERSKFTHADLAAIDLPEALDIANDTYTVSFDQAALIDAERNSLWRDWVYMPVNNNGSVTGLSGPDGPGVEAWNVYLPWLGGRGLPRYDEQNPLQYTDLDVYTVVLATQQFGRGLTVPRRRMRKDKLGFYNDVAAQLGRQAGEAAYLDFWRFMTTAAFTGAAPFGLAFDGAALLSTSHPYKDGTGTVLTYSNRSTAAFSEAAYNAAIAQIRNFRTPNGDTLSNDVRLHVVVGPSNEATARFIYEAQLGAGGQSNVQLFPASWQICHELTGAFAAYWFIFIERPGVARDRAMMFMQDIAPSLYSQMDLSGDNIFERDEYKWRAERSYGFCPGMPWAVFGSTGA